MHNTELLKIYPIVKKLVFLIQIENWRKKCSELSKLNKF